MRIEDWRAELNSIDNELLRLLNRRARVAVKAGAAETAARTGDSDDALERACRANAGPLGEQAVAKIFRRIVSETRRARRRDSNSARAWIDESQYDEVGELV
ncbi:MAG TPA: chorismate mutase [Pyrinomonadaceae bacterium]|nr:chorismate mutase [Pyrinomonadaceae bacterium]